MKILKKVKPLFNRVVTTMDCYEEDQLTTGGLVDSRKQKGTMKEYQTVVAVGDTVKSVKEGDVVCINPTRYAVMKHEDKSLKNGVIGDNLVIGYKFNTITIDGKEHLMLYDQDIDFIVVDSKEAEDPVTPIIIQPDKPKIII